MIDRINLLPEEMQAKKTFAKLPVRYIVVILLGLFYIIPAHLKINSSVKKANQKVASLDKKLKLIKADNQEFTDLHSEAEKLIDELKSVRKISTALSKVIVDRILWADTLKEISFMVPKKLWLSSLASHDYIISVEDSDTDDNDDDGEKSEPVEIIKKIVTIKGSSYNSKVIKKFVKELEVSYFLEDVKLKYVKKRIINDIYTVYDFEASSKLKDKNSTSNQ